MTTATKTASHYNVITADPIKGHIILHTADEMQDGIEWMELHQGSGSRFWGLFAIFTDGTSKRVA